MSTPTLDELLSVTAIQFQQPDSAIEQSQIPLNVTQVNRSVKLQTKENPRIEFSVSLSFVSEKCLGDYKLTYLKEEDLQLRVFSGNVTATINGDRQIVLCPSNFASRRNWLLVREDA